MAVGTLVFAAAPQALADDKVFYTNYQGGTISFANLDGSGSGGDLNTTGATVNLPTGVAIDIAAGRVYWPNEHPDADTISYAGLDGSGGGDLDTTGATVEGPNGIAIDPGSGKVYWANVRLTEISVANLDGSGGSDLDTTGATVAGARGVALDTASGTLYWANFDDGIAFADSDGSGGGGSVLTTGATPGGPVGAAIDPTTERIYWANPQANEISYANLDGSGGGDLVTTGATVSSPIGVAVDPYEGRVYWANQGGAPGSGISFASLDGSGGANVATTGATVNGAMYPALLKRPLGTGPPGISASNGVLSCTEGGWAPDLLGSFLYQVPQSVGYQWTRNGADVPGATTADYTPTASGTYRCRVSATNPAGSRAQTSATLKWRALSTTITSGPSGLTNNASPSFAFTSPQAGASFQCRLDSSGAGGWEDCDSPQGYSGLTNGSHKFEVRAVDLAGNADPTPAKRSFSIDTVAPNTTITSGPSGPTGDPSPSFTFTSPQLNVWFECRFDSTDPGAWQPCSSPKGYSSLANGSHKFEVRAVDLAGNADPTPARRSFSVSG